MANAHRRWRRAGAHRAWRDGVHAARIPELPVLDSLAALLLWGTRFGWICMRAFGDVRALAAVLLAVVSHWVLDVITHVPDMPLFPGGPTRGLGLWHSVPGTLVAEAMMFGVGVWVYARVTRPRDGIGRWGFLGLTALLGVGFIANGASPPPPSVTALWLMACALMALVVALAWWTDTHRQPSVWKPVSSPPRGRRTPMDVLRSGQ